MVQISLCPEDPFKPQKAILFPSGDHRGEVALDPLSNNLFWPVWTSTIHNSASPPPCKGSSSSVQRAICLPSGDHAGRNPKSVILRGDSPLAPITKIPPPSRSDRNAI